MAAPLVISISHALGKEEALRRLKPGLTRMTSGLPVLQVEKEEWNGDRAECSSQSERVSLGKLPIRRFKVTSPTVADLSYRSQGILLRRFSAPSSSSFAARTNPFASPCAHEMS